MTTLLRRLAAFGGLPLISMITPLIILPVLANRTGQAGWGSLLAGEGVGTITGILVSFGWQVVGPARVAATLDAGARARIYWTSLLTRGAMFLVATPIAMLIAWHVASPGFGPIAAAMALYGTSAGLTFAWFAVGASDARSIALLDAVPRVLAAGVSIVLVLATGMLLIYPLLSVTVVGLGIIIFSRRTLRGHHVADIGLRDIPRLLREGLAPAAIDIAGGAYGAVPQPVVTAMVPTGVGSSFASADKLYKFGLYVPQTLSNALQAWTVEGPVAQRGTRLLVALGAHTSMGLLGAAIMSLLGPWASRFLFGQAVEATTATCVAFGVAFFFVCIRYTLTRHVLIPAGRVKRVLGSTYAATAITIGALVPLVLWLGPIGGALALVAGEVVAVALQLPPGITRIQELRHPSAHEATRSDHRS